MIRIVVVDDHPLVRIGLTAAFDGAGGMAVVATAADGYEALDTVRAVRPDVVVMDVSMPGVDGLEATRQIRAVVPDVRVVVLTSFAAASGRIRASEVGANAYLGKEEPLDALLATVRAVAEGTDLLAEGGSGAPVAAVDDVATAPLTRPEGPASGAPARL